MRQVTAPTSSALIEYSSRVIGDRKHDKPFAEPANEINKPPANQTLSGTLYKPKQHSKGLADVMLLCCWPVDLSG